MLELSPQTKFQLMSHPFSNKILNWIKLNWTSVHMNLSTGRSIGRSVALCWFCANVDAACMGQWRHRHLPGAASSPGESLSDILLSINQSVSNLDTPLVEALHREVSNMLSLAVENQVLRESEIPDSGNDQALKRKQKHERNHLGSPGYSMRSKQIFILPLRSALS